jgi:hypothetical protein
MNKAGALALLFAVGWGGGARAATQWQHFFDAVLDDTTCPFNFEIQISLDFLSQVVNGQTQDLLRGTYTLIDLANGHTLVSDVRQTQTVLADGTTITTGIEQKVYDGHKVVAELVGQVVRDASGNVLSETGQNTLPTTVAQFCALVKGP